MVGQLLLELDYEISSLCETGNYLNAAWGYYSLCSRPLEHSPKYRVPFQRSYPLNTLPKILELVGKDRQADYWITQAVFSQKNRRKVNLAHVGVAFVDLDYYKVRRLADLPPEAVLDMVLTRCQAWSIPLPSLVVDSGQGLQIKWFHEKLPRVALPRWDHLQAWLNECLLDLGADTGAKDVSRILRVVQTVNQKNGGQVRVLWQQTEGYTQEPYSFNELIEAVYQAHISHCRDKPPAPHKTTSRQKKPVKSEVLPFKSGQHFSEDSLNWTRLCDLQALLRLRGDMGDGLREPMAFYLCNFFALRYRHQLSLNPLDNWQEFRTLFRSVAPHWSDATIKNKTSNLYRLTREDAAGQTVEFMGRQYRPLYTPKNDYLINLFGITDTEQRQLMTIISDDEYQRRERVRKSSPDYQEAHKQRERQRDEQRRRAAGAVKREVYLQESSDKRQQAIALYRQGMSQRKIAAELGVSRGAVENYLKHEPKQTTRKAKAFNQFLERKRPELLAFMEQYEHNRAFGYVDHGESDSLIDQYCAAIFSDDSQE